MAARLRKRRSRPRWEWEIATVEDPLDDGRFVASRVALLLDD